MKCILPNDEIAMEVAKQLHFDQIDFPVRQLIEKLIIPKNCGGYTREEAEQFILEALENIDALRSDDLD